MGSDWNWNYSGPAEELVAEIHNCFFKSFEEFTDEYKSSVRTLCHQAIELDEDCYPAYAGLGYLDHTDDDREGMMENYLKAIDRCPRPLDSDILMETLFLGLYEESWSKPEVWPYIVRLWERVHDKQPRLKSLRSICIACRFSGDHSFAHRALDDWQAMHPEDAIKLAKLAFKNLEDPRKAVQILERYLIGNPLDRKAERYLKKIEKRID